MRIFAGFTTHGMICQLCCLGRQFTRKTSIKMYPHKGFDLRYILIFSNGMDKKARRVHGLNTH